MYWRDVVRAGFGGGVHLSPEGSRLGGVVVRVTLRGEVDLLRFGLLRGPKVSGGQPLVT